MKTILFMCCCIFAATFLEAQIIHVPGDYPMIQQGINAANPGDTVLIAEGIYYERINFMGKKPLMVASEFLLDGDESHIDNTIVDGSLFPYPNNNSVVYFILGEDTTSVLCGFTIQNGRGTVYHFDTMTIKAGGGIFISSSGAKIIHNHITQNHVNYNPLDNSIDLFDGAAIATEWKIDSNWVVIENNVIDENTCISANLQAGGAGICVYCNSIIANNMIINNISEGLENSSAVAGGLACATYPVWNNTVIANVHHNTIAFNVARAENNFASCAGVIMQHVTGIFQNNDVSNNESVTWYSSGGVAGLGIFYPQEGTIVSGNYFSENNSNLWAGAINIETSADEVSAGNVVVENNYFLINHALKGGAVVLYNVMTRLQNNVFSGNIADNNGGAIFMKKDIDLPVTHMVKLVNNSFYSNTAINGGAIFSQGARPLIFNCIFSEDHATNGSEMYIPFYRDTVEIAYSNIDMSLIYGNKNDGGWNINEIPLYKDKLRLTLEWGSPCLDVGTEAYTCDCGVLHNCPLYDIEGFPRTEGLVDLGAHELLITGCPQHSAENSTTELSVYPNPISGIATFEYNLTTPGHILIDIFDFNGRSVTKLVNEYQSEGIHRLQWNSDGLADGIYFYRLSEIENLQTITGKIVLVR